MWEGSFDHRGPSKSQLQPPILRCRLLCTLLTDPLVLPARPTSHTAVSSWGYREMPTTSTASRWTPGSTFSWRNWPSKAPLMLLLFFLSFILIATNTEPSPPQLLWATAAVLWNWTVHTQTPIPTSAEWSSRCHASSNFSPEETGRMSSYLVFIWFLKLFF